jgi:uncharacterized protein (TIGR02996 family)
VTDRAAMLAGILAAPDDDAPRLIYADWLTENGEADRGEFIRVQCELARLDGGDRCPVCHWPYKSDRHGGCTPGDCSFRPDDRAAEYAGWKQRQTAYHDLRRRGLELADAWTHIWTQGISASLIVFRRGFLHTLAMRADNWVASADAILAAHPVSEVRLTTWPRVVDVELSNPINTEPRPKMRWQGGRTWVDVSAGFPSGMIAWTRMLLAAEWPSVKTWHLPEPQARRSLPDLTTPAAREAIRRAMESAGAAVRRFAERMAADRRRRPTWKGVEAEVARATQNARLPRSARRPSWTEGRPPR